MPKTNVKYKKGLVEGTSFAIERSIMSLLDEKANAYDDILAAFSVSKCDHAEALRAQLEAEKMMVTTLAAFYRQMLFFIKRVSNDLDKVETHYGIEHVSGGE